MLQRFLPLIVKIRERFPGLYYFLVGIAKRFMGDTFGVYPRPLANEIGAAASVLRSSQWNMAYGRGLVHERLEAEFAQSVGAGYAIAVSSGGVALQMSMRGLGLKPGHEAIHQVDTCAATAMAVMNAGVTPLFADISPATFMLDSADVSRRIGSETKALIATHMWGNPEDLAALRALARERGLWLIEDACLGLGAVVDGKPAGAWGDVGVFSFGCVKPIQTGEGGMIVTSDEALARELRSLRHWGDRTIEYGVRDATQLAWNGRMSEVLAAIAREQLKGYPAHLAGLREAVGDFIRFLENLPGLSIVLGTAENWSSCAFTQVVLRVDERALGVGKDELMKKLTENGVSNWHANFELINSVSLFRTGGWRDWILRGDAERVAANNMGAFPAAEQVYRHAGIGLAKTNFLSKGNRAHLQSVLKSLTGRTGA
jgi:dTDP-4-amino-4,6-dideoxygalactose transaminase